MASRKVAKREVRREGFAVLDFGSTALRVSIAVTETDLTSGKRGEPKLQQVQEHRTKHDRGMRFDPGEFPSVGCPFDGPPYLVGFDATSQSTKRVISLKSIPYFRAQQFDGNVFSQDLFSHSNALPSIEAREEFEAILDGMLLTFFTSIVTRIIEKSNSKAAGFRLRTLALSIPNAWSARESNIQDYLLKGILDKTVKGLGVEVVPIFEAQAQAQFIIHRHPDQLTIYDYLLVLDFGGHSMGGFHGELVWSRESATRPRIISTTRSEFGARGGYEQWEIGIGHCLDKERRKRRQGSGSFSEDQWHLVRAALLKSFFLKKAYIKNEDDCRLKADLDEIPGLSDRNQYVMRLPSKQVNKAWERAFRDVIKMAKEHIGHVAKNNKDILVLLSGGSIENTKAKKEITNFCNSFKYHDGLSNVDCRHVSDDYDVVFLKWMIAEGGASCLANTMDVEEFFDLGGGLGLQTYAKSGYWSNNADLLLYKKDGKKHMRSVEITNSDGSRFRLTGNPHYQQPRKSASKMYFQECYDILDIPLEFKPTADAERLFPIPRGREMNYVLEVVELVCRNTEATLLLRLRPRGTRTPNMEGKRRSERVFKGTGLADGQSYLLEVPLTSDGSSNLVELDRDLMQGRVWSFEGPEAKKQ